MTDSVRWPPRILTWYWGGEEIADPTEEEKAWMLVLGEHPDAFRVDSLGLLQPPSPSSRRGLGAIDLTEFQHEPQPLALGFINPEGTTVLFGEGGDGKGWVAARWASRLDRVAILDFEQHPHEWAYRLNKFGKNLKDIIYFAPVGSFERWAEHGGAEQLQESGARYLIVDSAVYAVHTDDAYGPEGAMSYKRARALVGNPPSILIAHTAKGQDSVFGSVFWGNEARLIWRMYRNFKGGRYLQCKKSNNYDIEGKKYTVEFDEQQGILEFHEQGKAWTASPAVVEAEADLRW